MRSKNKKLASLRSRSGQKSTKILDANSEESVNRELLSAARLSAKECLIKYNSRNRGLTPSEVRRRLFRYGANEITKEHKRHWALIFLRNFYDPLSILLLALAMVSFFTHDYRATLLISIMVVLSVVLRFIQEVKADRAAERLRAMVHKHVRVLRDGRKHRIALEKVTVGDIVKLSAGDMVPADLRIISSKDLFVNQASLTGEALPVEKHSDLNIEPKQALEAENLCFMGTHVESGTALGVIIATGGRTYLGRVAGSIINQETLSNFDIGVKKFTWLIMRFLFVMVPAVFLINAFSKGDWFEAFIFSLAVAIGLTPEMLPMILAVNLSKGAIAMSKKKVIVKRLAAIQNFGAMDILCTDKTGTLTEGRVVLEKYINIKGDEDIHILEQAYLNSYFQTGLNNLIDVAVLKHKELKKDLIMDQGFKKIDELPFDFIRRRMSVIVENKQHEQFLICKGAVEEVIALCRETRIGDQVVDLDELEAELHHKIEDSLNNDGFRVMAVAMRKIEQSRADYSVKDEKDLILLGFLAFLDPPKASAREAIEALNAYGVKIKVLTGDNHLVARKICSDVGLNISEILRGEEIDLLSDAQLTKRLETVDVAAKLTPHHKERIINLLRAAGHVVGYLGDGINDGPALKAADVGVSVDSAVDIAKESSDIILLEKNLLVLRDGIIEGRKIFGNIVKYIQMAASSNFGNMLSVVGASIFLPFLPMLPLQILVNNLLYDISQTSIPSDHVDVESLQKPQPWDLGKIKKFILFIGPISSLFDYATFFVMLYIFNAWVSPALFHTGWFVESIFTQTLIIYVIRTNKIPFLQSWPSRPLMFTTLAIVAIAGYLPYSPIASYLGFVPLPALYWLILAGFIVVYICLTQFVKTWFLRHRQLC